MSVDDEKISNNRRRLFKALSAAPVVVTLNPGAALANASAFHCLAKDATFDFIPADLESTDCSGISPCFAYELFYYWIVPPETTGAECSLAGETIVEVVEDANVVGFYTLGGDPVSMYVSKDSSNNELNINFPQSGNCANSSFQKITASQGHFLVFFEPVDADGNSVSGNSGEGVDIFPVGVFPKTQRDTNYQGITHTCLCSIHPDATGTFVRHIHQG